MVDARILRPTEEHVADEANDSSRRSTREEAALEGRLPDQRTSEGVPCTWFCAGSSTETRRTAKFVHLGGSATFASALRVSSGRQTLLRTATLRGKIQPNASNPSNDPDANRSTIRSSWTRHDTPAPAPTPIPRAHHTYAASNHHHPGLYHTGPQAPSSTRRPSTNYQHRA